MTTAEKLISTIVVGLVALALLLPAEAVEFALVAQIIIVGFIALAAGVYVWLVNRDLTRPESEYLWILVRRDKRVALGFVMLLLLGLAVLIPRISDVAPFFQRPWYVLWLVIAIDLFAVGLIDDALLVRRDRSVK